MRDDELRDLFDRQAARYDAQWEAMAPIRDGLHRLMTSAFADLPDDARVLAVGVGTGAELAPLARQFPGWRFTAVDPSGRMLDVCRRRAEREGFAARCAFHEGTLDTLPPDDGHHAATCVLVSQFVLNRDARSAFFRAIADRLVPGGLLASADLATAADALDVLLPLWMRVMAGADVSDEQVERVRAAYATDVAILSPAEVASVIEAGGFELPAPVYQAGLLHAWLARRGG
jgi:tRNA (cmo5U34)-methyltransferase